MALIWLLIGVIILITQAVAVVTSKFDWLGAVAVIVGITSLINARLYHELNHG
jgi:uncharacterized membrane protein HdeD (DUF308 family)